MKGLSVDVMVRESLVKIRHDAGLTQRELAHQAGRVQSWIAKIESGDRDLRMSDLVVIAAVLEMPVHRLVERLTASPTTCEVTFASRDGSSIAAITVRRALVPANAGALQCVFPADE